MLQVAPMVERPGRLQDLQPLEPGLCAGSSPALATVQQTEGHDSPAALKERWPSLRLLLTGRQPEHSTGATAPINNLNEGTGHDIELDC